MFNFIKNIFNKFFNYLGSNNCESFELIKQEDEYSYTNNVINIRDILKRKKTKVDVNDSGSLYRDKDKEKRKADLIDLVIKKNKISYVAFIKKQRMTSLLKKVAKTITNKLFPQKQKKVDHSILMYKMNLIVTKIKILKTLEKKCDVLDISKSVVYLDEGMDTFLNRVKHNIKSNTRTR